MSDVYKKFTPELYEAVYQVEEDQDGMRLDQYCATFLVTFSRQNIKKKIKDGDIKIFNRPYPHKASVKVYHREQIQIKTYRGTLEDEYWNGELIDLKLDPDIIFEDDQVIAISKPAYMATHPTGKHLFNCATVYFDNKFDHSMCSIHRLDRETSGVLLLAKNPKSANQCTELFERSLVSKCYFFMAHKRKDVTFPVVATERLGTIDNFAPRNFNHWFPEESTDGKHAKTTFFDLYQDDDYIIGMAFPKTGRQHQIRCHAAAHGFPLIGDKLYNGDPTVFMRFKDLLATKDDHDLMQLPRHALHALALKLGYPSEGNPTTFRASLPEDFKGWISENLPKISIKNLEEKIDEKLKERFDV
jgi:RluA family pseudouridine synthase